MIQSKKNIDLLILYAGLFFISIVTLPFICQSVLFIIHITTSNWLFPTICMAALAVCVYQLKQFISVNTIALWLIGVILLLVSIYLLCITFYDFSYDGMWYQQDGVLLIAEGWNPYTHYLTLKETSLCDLYLNHYPKATWISAGSIYAFTNKLETGKMINWYAVIAALCLCFLTLKSLCNLNTFTLVLLSVLLASNPVVIYQLFTFYVDGLIGSMLTIMLCVALLFQTQKISAQTACYCTILLVSFTVNIKFTALIYVFVFAFGYTVFLLLRQRITWIKQTALLGSICILAVVVFGYPTYMQNLIHQGHPFYPIMGKGNIGQEVAKVTMPSNFLDKNRFEQFNLATFSRAQWSRAPMESKAKALFTSDSFTILDEYKRADPEMSGFGPLFAEIILLVTVGLIPFLLFKKKKMTPFYLLILATLTISIIIIPSFWYARYTPQTWLLVLLLIIPFLEHPKLNVLGYIICFLVFVNCGIVAQQNMFYRIKQTDALNKQFDAFKHAKKPPIIYDGWVQSFKMKLKENDVKYTLTLEKYPVDSITFISNVEMSGAFYVNSSLP